MRENHKHNTWKTAVITLLCYCLLPCFIFASDFSENQVKVTIYPTPTFKIKDTVICQRAEVNLQDLVTNVSNNATVFFYSDALGLNPVSDIQLPSTTTTYYARAVHNATHCVSAIDSLTITLGNPAQIIDITPSVTLCERSSMLLEVMAIGTDLKYQWFLNGEKINGATSSIYTIASVSREEQGTYTINVWNDCNSEPLKDSVNVDIRWDGLLVVKFFDVILVDNHNDWFTAYQWYYNGELQPGERKQFFEHKEGLNGLYRAELTLTDGSKIMTCDTLVQRQSDKLNVKVYPNPTKVSNEITINVEGNIIQGDITKVEIFNILGQLHGTYNFTNKINTIKIDVSGVYLFRVTLPNGIIRTEKVTVK